jgi:hypothetical protein
MSNNGDLFIKLKSKVARLKKILAEIESISSRMSSLDKPEKRLAKIQLGSLKTLVNKTNKDFLETLSHIFVPKLNQQLEKESKDYVFDEALLNKKIDIPKTPEITKKDDFILRKSLDAPLLKKIALLELERETLKRLKRTKKEITVKKIKKTSKYVKFSNKLFSKFSNSLVNEGKFKILRTDLSKSNMQFVPASYVSVIFFTTILSIFIGGLIFLFSLFFNIGVKLPIITLATEGTGVRLLKTFWILFAVPIVTFFSMYFYPSLERKSVESKINQELPFATIHMSAISGSMIDPTKIFNIIISTNEYPNLEREFNKLINQIHVYGYDVVTALKTVAVNCPSMKLAELYNGIAVTINSGGSLPRFFDKRSQSLLFEHRIEREKNTKFAETFMDIYISVVIAAPMILMLLLIMMKISGLGISISTPMIALIMVLGVSILNVIFLTFLHLKQPSG